VTSVSKDQSAFIYKVRQSLDPQMWCSFESLETTELIMAEYPTRFKFSSNMLVPLYQVTWHHVPDICTLDTHNGEKLNLIYVKNVKHFHQLNLHDMCLSIVENPTLPPKCSYTIKLTAVHSQWLLTSF
jgi:hypothetical protein